MTFEVDHSKEILLKAASMLRRCADDLERHRGREIMSSHGCHIDSCIDHLLVASEKYVRFDILITASKKELDDAVADGNTGLANMIEQDIEHLTGCADIHSKAVDAFRELIKKAALGE